MQRSSFERELDPACLEGLRQGSRRAQEQVFRQFQGPVYTLALRLCQDRDEALDVLQDTFLRAFDQVRRFRGEAPFWGWLRRIAVNSSLGRLRSARRRSFSALPELAEEGGPNPAAQLDLAGALAGLPPDSRAVVWLYDVEGYSHQEIAEFFGRSVSFSKTQLSRAHARLRERLNPDGGTDLCPQIAT